MNDEDLRSKISNELENFYRFGSDDEEDVRFATDIITNLIKQDREARDIESRKDELARIDRILMDDNNPNAYGDAVLYAGRRWREFEQLTTNSEVKQ